MFDAVVLAGGTGRRLGGLDKAGLVVGDATLLGRALAALAGADRIVVVGPDRPLPPGVLQTVEDPVGGGPAAGLAAGVAETTAATIVVLACDLPLVHAVTVAALVDALETASPEVDGAAIVDDTGRLQPLLAAYRTSRLRAALEAVRSSRDPATLTGAPARDVVGRLRMLDVVGHATEAWDCDTWDDLRRARRQLDTAAAEPAPPPLPPSHEQEQTCR